MLDNPSDMARFIALSTMLTLALYQDAVHRKIPNTLVLAGALTGAGLSLAPTGIGLISSLAGGMVGLLGFGLVGLFIGPVVLAVTYTLLEAWVEDALGKSDE